MDKKAYEKKNAAVELMGLRAVQVEPGQSQPVVEGAETRQVEEPSS